MADLVRRLGALESKAKLKAPDDWRERLARYKRWFEDNEEWQGPKTDEEKARFARYKRYFDNLEAGVAAPRWEQ
jgi:hypothetical protein